MTETRRHILMYKPSECGTCSLEHRIEWLDGYPAKMCKLSGYIGIDWTLLNWLLMLPIMRAAERANA